MTTKAPYMISFRFFFFSLWYLFKLGYACETYLTGGSRFSLWYLFKLGILFLFGNM